MVICDPATPAPPFFRGSHMTLMKDKTVEYSAIKNILYVGCFQRQFFKEIVAQGDYDEELSSETFKGCRNFNYWRNLCSICEEVSKKMLLHALGVRKSLQILNNNNYHIICTSQGVVLGPTIKTFHWYMLFSSGLPLTPAGGSF